jgi:multidrug transporter EmrE-like cation transporter
VKTAHLAWIVISVMCSSLAHLALKLGAMRLDFSAGLADVILRLATNGWLIVGATLHVFALALWVVGLRHVELTVAYPFIALGFILVSLLSWMFLSETVSVTRLMGMLLIGAGVVLIART